MTLSSRRLRMAPSQGADTGSNPVRVAAARSTSSEVTGFSHRPGGGGTRTRYFGHVVKWTYHTSLRTRSLQVQLLPCSRLERQRAVAFHTGGAVRAALTRATKRERSSTEECRPDMPVTWVQLPPFAQERRLVARTSALQAGHRGFESRRSYQVDIVQWQDVRLSIGTPGFDSPYRRNPGVAQWFRAGAL